MKKHGQKKMDYFIRQTLKHAHQTPEANQALEQLDKAAYRQTKYINDWSGYPLYQNTEVTYYSTGEKMFPDMLAELEKAKHYIFLEYFIVKDGYMLARILDILERKAKAGVDVRLIYDDIGNIITSPKRYFQGLKERGIKCMAYNPSRPGLSEIINHRDHRKIMIIDGKVGFTGGMNLADEYINHVEVYGYWKDTGVRLKGEAVWSLVLMFLSMWDCLCGKREHYEKFRPKGAKQELLDENKVEKYVRENDGFVQPYCNCPFDAEYICETVYINIINQAMDYLYISTPYLIIDKEMLLALCNTAKRGVDVRIVTPGIPDKRLIYWVTQSYYKPLIECGVKIYQYRPGFLHAKSFLCDDKIATIGSVNLDYRSLYLHFECGVFMYRTKAITDMKKDFSEMFASSDEVTKKFCEEQHVTLRLLQGVMRVFAPML